MSALLQYLRSSPPSVNPDPEFTIERGGEGPGAFAVKYGRHTLAEGWSGPREEVVAWLERVGRRELADALSTASSSAALAAQLGPLHQLAEMRSLQRSALTAIEREGARVGAPAVYVRSAPSPGFPRDQALAFWSRAGYGSVGDDVFRR